MSIDLRGQGWAFDMVARNLRRARGGGAST